MKTSSSRTGWWSAAALAIAVVTGCSDTTAKPEPKSSTSVGPGGSAAPAGKELAEFDTARLTPNEKREFYGDLKALLSPCEKVAVPLYQCIAEKRDCKACVPAGNYLLAQVQKGTPKEVRADFYKGRYTSKAVEVPVTDAPTKGPEKAIVTIVEWADFECPHCKLLSPLLDALVERFPGQVRLAYKFYPIAGHKDADVAARGGFASIGQGKFWEMHHALFDNQGMNDRSGIIKLAKKIGLDVDQFKKDMADDEASNRIERDRKQADDLGLDGTPYVFVNGTRLQLESLTSPYYADLESFVAVQIEKAGGVPAAAPPGFKAPADEPTDGPAPGASGEPSASAAPSAAPSSAPSASAAPATSAAPK